MNLSLNETHKLVKDAARGSGMSFGEADELACASVWLEVAGLPGVINANRVIDEQLNDLAAGVDLAQRDGWELAPRYAKGDGRIDALAAATCARDLVAGLIADESTPEPVRIKSVFLPMIAIGLIASLDPGRSRHLKIETRNADGDVTENIVRTCEAVYMQDVHRDARPAHPLIDMTITIAAEAALNPEADARCVWSPDVHQRTLERGLSPDTQALDTLATLARNCLVPATEESRLKGAGAGTIDRD